MKVKLFGGLRRIAGASEIPGKGSTITEVLQNLGAQNKELHEAIFADGTSELRPHVRVIVNGLDCELADGLATPVRAGDNIAVFPPIAGG